jgi:DNA-binding IclR family transcriptional regulator
MLVKQAANVIQLLEFFAERAKPASLAEISMHFGWPRSSTFNLLSTLATSGYLYEPGARGRFYPTPSWLHLSNRITSAEPVPEPLQQLVRHLADKTDETVCLSAPSGQHIVFLEVIQATAPIRYAADVGKRIPIHVSASGQAILSQLPPNHRAAILRKAVLERYADHSPMSIAEVEDSIMESLRRGWFRSASNYSQDLGGVSVPLVLSERIFSVTIAGPLYRMTERMYHIALTVHAAVEIYLGRDFLKQHAKGLTTPPLAG